MTVSWLVDHRAALDPAMDQGNRPTCLPCATCAAQSFSLGSATSVEYLHYQSRLHAGVIGTFSGARTALDKDGVPPEHQWPYDPRANDRNRRPPKEVVGPYAFADFAVNRLPDSSFLMTALEGGALPIVGLATTQPFVTLRGNVLTRLSPHLDGHAVLLVGVAQYEGLPINALSNGDLLYCIRNSWGVGWGANGYGLIAEAVWEDIVEVAGFVTPK